MSNGTQFGWALSAVAYKTTATVYLMQTSNAQGGSTRIDTADQH
jgi:hypothetical protein